jgi:hypothetical protein
MVLADANTNAIVLTFSTGQSGGATAGYLKARSSNAAAIRVGSDNDLSNEPYASLAAGETLPILLDYERATAMFARGTAADVLEFVADASE